jgi:hypothetical protein
VGCFWFHEYKLRGLEWVAVIGVVEVQSEYSSGMDAIKYVGVLDQQWDIGEPKTAVFRIGEAFDLSKE